MIAEWQAGGGHLPTSPDQITITELVARYWAYTEEYYSKAGADNLKPCLRALTGLYGDTPAARFGPLAQRTVRQGLIDKGSARSYINEEIAKIRRVFRWAVAEELIGPTVLQALMALPGRRRGRIAA